MNWNIACVEVNYIIRDILQNVYNAFVNNWVTVKLNKVNTYRKKMD